MTGEATMIQSRLGVLCLSLAVAGAACSGQNEASTFGSVIDEEDMRQAVVDALEGLMEVIASEEQQREAINASLSEEVSMCLSDMTPCSHMSRDDYAGLVSGIDWIEGSVRDVDVTIHDDMSGAISLHIQEGAYMTDEGRVEYSTRVSSVWNLTSGTPRMVHANYAPMGGSGIPARQ